MNGYRDVKLTHGIGEFDGGTVPNSSGTHTRSAGCGWGTVLVLLADAHLSFHSAHHRFLGTGSGIAFLFECFLSGLFWLCADIIHLGLGHVFSQRHFI